MNEDLKKLKDLLKKVNLSKGKQLSKEEIIKHFKAIKPIGKFKRFSEADELKDTIELTEFTDAEALRKAIGKDRDLDKILFKGKSIMDLIYNNEDITKDLEDEVGIGKDFKPYDDDDYTEKIDGQECYLGYDVKDQSFHCGFDIFEGDMKGGVVNFQFLDNVTSRFKVLSTDYGIKGFYYSLYEEIKKDPAVVDLRLD